jgi:hypothetical protein
MAPTDMGLRRVLATIGALITLASSAVSAQAQSGLYFYCYAPDPESGTVYMSQPLPAGPVAERAGYGAAYVAHLRSTKRMKGEGQAYCTMRGSEAELTSRGKHARNVPASSALFRWPGRVVEQSEMPKS